jgi:para-aminobenzoate synthetase component 1
MPLPAGNFLPVAALEWHLSDGGDPAAVLASFLARWNLGPPFGQPSVTESERLDGVGDAVVGAVVLLSAAAGAVIAGAPPGRPSPAPLVPDVVAVVFADARSSDPSAGDPWPLSGGPWSADPFPGGLWSGKPSQPWWLGEWEASWSPAEHAAAVEAVRAAIARGDVYQCNLVGHASAPFRGDPWPALRRVAGLPGAAYSWLLAGQGWAVACASPETLLRVRGRHVETLPIKGTRPATPEGRAELLASLKERAEHVMIVDLERNDLARVARTGSVTVPTLFAVRRWCDLWQAESRITATLADDVDLAALLRALLPGGSVTGAPKLAATSLIAELEPVGRGPSMGAVGWIDRSGLDLGLTIRTVAVSGDRVHVWAGGGITWDSDPVAEVAEAAAKAAPLRAALAG